jgi:hypothetical protein
MSFWQSSSGLPEKIKLGVEVRAASAYCSHALPWPTVGRAAKQKQVMGELNVGG